MNDLSEEQKNEVWRRETESLERILVVNLIKLRNEESLRRSEYSTGFDGSRRPCQLVLASRVLLAEWYLDRIHKAIP